MYKGVVDFCSHRVLVAYVSIRRLPIDSAPLIYLTATEIKTDGWKGKKVVLFSVPGAFTASPSAVREAAPADN